MAASSSIDPKAVGLKVGIEVHQQLATKKKLFCSCPIVKSETLPLQFERRLRPTQSELGHIDPAAVFEFAKGRSNVYRWNPESSCLVEADEEPPHKMNEEAIDTSILIAQLLHSNLVDEIHVMRKIVIDGSNTSGFQRTAVIALGGELSVEGEEVGVQTVTLEEDAARILGEDAHSRFFALDRLGVSLVEISLDPIMGTPEQVEKAALYLGRALRSTGRVARGLGTIRQDLNISTTGGSVVEVKGVQKLNLLAKVIVYELTRQVGLGKIAADIKKRGIRRVRCTTKDVTDLFRSATSKVLVKSVKSGERVVCVSAEGLAGLLGYEPYQGIRLGKELAEIARANSLGGVIHSDEFGRQGVSKEEAEELEKAMGAGKGSAFVLVAGDESKANGTAALLEVRLGQALGGVPAETRAATEEGETRYMRPRPGPARMYPETDVPEIVVSPRRKERLFEDVPVPWGEKVKEYEKKYSLSPELALQVYDSEFAHTFERLAQGTRLTPSVIATLLVEIPVRLTREGIKEEKIGEEVLVELVHAIDEGRVAKEAAPDLLRVVGEGKAVNVEEAAKFLKLKRLGQAELGRIIDEVVRKNRSMILSKGEDAFSPLMGEVMKEVRGRVDGQLVGEALRLRLRKRGKGKG